MRLTPVIDQSTKHAATYPPVIAAWLTVAGQYTRLLTWLISCIVGHHIRGYAFRGLLDGIGVVRVELDGGSEL